LNQVEYATKSVSKNGEACIGTKSNKGCVIVSEKKPKSALYDMDSIKKIVKINENVAISFSGLSPDFQVLAASAHKAQTDYNLKYGEDISPLMLVQNLSAIMQEYTQANGVRPFGVSLLVCGFQSSTKEFCIYQCDPAGTYFALKGVAIGENSDDYTKIIERVYEEDITIEESIETALKALNDKSGYTLAGETLEICIIDSNGVKLLSNEDIDIYVRQI